MKLAYILNTYPQRSHSFIRREIHALERRGITVKRFAMRSAEVLIDPADKAEQARTEHVLALGAMGLLWAAARQVLAGPARFLGAIRLAVAVGRQSNRGWLRHMIYLAEACHVAARCRAEGVQHLHAHFGTNATVVAMLAGALAGLPYSFTVHGPEEFDSPQAFGLGIKMHRAAFTVAISQFGRSQLCRWADPADWDRIKVVHCGIEPAAFADPGSPKGHGLACIGRFAEQKGHLTLVDAVARLGDAIPDLRISLIGDGEMRGLIDAAIKDRGVEKYFRLTGWLDENGVRTELADASALVMPSFAEGLPVVMMEAMAAGRPVIGTYIAGIPELVQPETGWLVPAGDAAALEEALRAFAQASAAQLLGMGKAGRARVLKRHDIDIEAGRLADLFEAAVSG